MEEASEAPDVPSPVKTFVDAALAPLRNYGELSGRSSRLEFWSFGLAATVALGSTIGLAFVVLAVADVASDFAAVTIPLYIVTVLLFAVYIFGVVLLFMPWLAVSVRRLHDTNHSGGWLLATLFLMPFGPLIVLSFLVTAGTPGSNRYGPNPYGGEDDPPVAPARPSSMGLG